MFRTWNNTLIDDIYTPLFDFDWDIYFHDDEFISCDPLVWLIEPERHVYCGELGEYHCLSEDCEQVKLIGKALDDPSKPLPYLIEQSDSDSET